MLLTAFGPFPGAPVNPTPAVIARAAELAPASFEIETMVLDTEFAAVPARLAEAAARKPEIVVMTGLASRASLVRLERRARNEVTAGRLDAAGRDWPSGLVDAGAPEVLSATADLLQAQAALTRAGVEFELSEDAGRYVCEFAYFHALRLFAAARVVFVHVPPIAPADGAQTGQAALTETEAARAVAAVLVSQAPSLEG
ncbi:MAG: hypothetical protein RKE49_13210 [Oceanicaulis sp.]